MTTDIIHDQDQDKRIHLFLAETFMNLGNAYKVIFFLLSLYHFL